MTNLLKKWTETSLVLRIVIGLVLGTVLGLLVPSATAIGILGTLFVSALKAIAPILVAVLVMASIAKASSRLGARFRNVIFRYLLSTFMAAMCAVVASMLFPVTLKLSDVSASTESTASLADVFSNLLTNMVANPISSITNANYIGILFWAILMGVALKMIASKETISVVQDLSEVVSQIVKWIIQFAPFGILGLVFTTVSTNGVEVFTTYGHLLLLLVGCMLANTFIFNPFISFLMIKKNPYPLLFTCLKESGLNAFFTR